MPAARNNRAESEHHRGSVSDLKTTHGSGQPNERGEVRYDCPFCELLRGKPDRQGKFYFNVKKRRGLCFRCGAYVAEEPEYDLEADIRNYLAALGVEEETEAIEPEWRKRTYTLRGWTESVYRDLDAVAYLYGRGIGHDQIARFGLRVCQEPVHGIVLPNADLGNDRTDYFQIRDLGGGWTRYLNPGESAKPIYGAARLGGCTAAFLCEGVFSAISATRYGTGFGAICTYGKSVKDDQIEAISELPVPAVWVMYDGGEFGASLAAARQVTRAGKAVRVVFLPYGQDPNEISEDQLRISVDRHSVEWNDLTRQFLLWVKDREGIPPGSPWDARSWNRLLREVEGPRT